MLVMLSMIKMNGHSPIEARILAAILTDCKLRTTPIVRYIH